MMCEELIFIGIEFENNENKCIFIWNNGCLYGNI